MELNQSLENLMPGHTKLWTKRMTNLENFLIMLLSLGVCVIIACLVNIGMRDNEKPCVTRGCIKAASQILKQIDEDIDPCEDFYKFSCGKLINITHEKQAHHRKLENQIEKQLHVLSESVDANDHPVIKYQKQLFTACKNATEGDKSFETFKEILKEMSGWPVVEGTAWDENKFDFVDIMGKLRRNGLQFSSVLMMSLQKTHLNKEQKIVKVNFPFPNRVHDLYFKLMVDVAVIFGANRSSAITEITHLQNFINSISKFRDEHLGIMDNELYEVTEEELQNFQDEFPGIDWLKMINAILEPVAKIDSQYVIIFPTAKFMYTYLRFINETPKRLLCNYILWYAIEDLLPLLSEDLQEIYNDYRCLAGSDRRSHIDMCKLAIRQTFGPIATYLAYAKKRLTTATKEKVENIYKHIKLEFTTTLKRLPVTVDTQNDIQKSLKRLEAVIGFREKEVDNALFDKFYKGDLFNKEPVEDKGFLRTYLHFKWKVENVWIENVQISNMSISELLIYYQIPRTETMYLDEDHVLAIPVGMLHNLFYESDKPMFSHFATLGKNIAVALFNIFNDLDVFGDNGKSVWSELIKVHCIESERSKKNNLMENEDIRISEQIGLQIAYNAFIKWNEENKERYSIPGVKYNPNQLFWVSSMSDQCLQDDFYTLNVHRNNLAVRQNSDFINDFHCDSDAKMSLSGKCDVF